MASTDDLIRQILEESKQRQDRAGAQNLGRGGQPHRKKTTVLEDIKSFKEPLRGLADAFAGALRGSVAGTVGFPGDLESLGRGALSALGAPSGARLDALISGMEQPTVLPTTERMRKVLPKATSYDNPYEELGTFMPLPGSTAAARLAGKGVAAVGKEAGRRINEAMLTGDGMLGAALAPVAPMGVVKGPGGNWLPESTKALEGLKGEDAALNNFIDKQLTRYVRNQMATPEDPIRALAEKGTLHFVPERIEPTRRLDEKRKAFAEKNEGRWGYGKGVRAQLWEDASDQMINAVPAEVYQNFGSSNMTGKPGWEWINKVDPDTPLYGLNQGVSGRGGRDPSIESLGFPHLIDELRNATNPESGLPRELLIKPESLSKLSVPQAVERVAKINEWRAAQKAEADAARAMNPATFTHKEYPEGYRWVELKQPEGAENTDVLADALKYEGETMGHCVGGYCPDVLEGRSRIYSLRDKKGQPHVTVEVRPRPTYTEEDVIQQFPGGVTDAMKAGDIGGRNYIAQKLAEINSSGSDRIVQIKGKANRAPNEEYLPYVQDFVRSGQWSDVGDLHNTGLYKTHASTGLSRDIVPELSGNARLLAHGRARAAGDIQPYMTKAELEAVIKKHAPEDIWSRPGEPMTEADITGPWEPENGMKRGGAVKPCNQDAMQMAIWDKAVKKSIGGDLLKAAKGIKAARALAAAKEAENATPAAAPFVFREAYTAADRAAAGRKAAELIASQPQIKASEALGQLREKGVRRTTTTQADRTRVGGGNIGGAAFPAISEADPAYAGKVWGVMDEGTAARLKNLTDPETAWTTMLGSAAQLKTNPIVFDKLKRGFISSMKEGKLTPELADKINHNLALIFGEGADIRDPKIWKEANTFEKRAALADVMMGQGIPPSKGGVAIGGEKSGKGVIFKPTEILVKETEPSLLHPEHGGDVPTFAAGPRLFSLEKETSYRPDLHPGFPTLISGKDLGVNMLPTPTEVYLPDWHKAFSLKNPTRKPGYYDLAFGIKGEGLPSQELTDEYIRHLIREGYKKGGKVKKAARKASGGKVKQSGKITNFPKQENLDAMRLAVMDKAIKKAPGGLLKAAAKAAKFVDPPSTKLEDWAWRPFEQVRKDVPITEVPDYVQKGYGEFMKDQMARAKAGNLSERDLLKAYLITQSSIGRRGLAHSTATKAGLKLPNLGEEVRPEGAFATWLGSKEGQKYLDAAAKGNVDQKAVESIREKFSPFGKQNDLADKMIDAVQLVPSMALNLNQSITGSPTNYRNFAEQLSGIAAAKSGFIGSLLGRGDLPTFDARQIDLHTKGVPRPIASVGSILDRGKGIGGREAVDRQAARQEAMKLAIDPSLDPYYQHLSHHAIWDAVGGEKTTHQDLIDAMRNYVKGGLVKAGAKK